MVGDRDEAAEARRRARQACEVRIVRPGDTEAEADASALDWARIPLDERAEFVWQLSVELGRLAAQGSTADVGRHWRPRQ
ncbi:MAG TPA: hypothetical protein VFS43_04770 [Polyangiaceae bacterium]|nr:hypothetical protein [Polyangiaceae bacterium]